MKSYGVSHLKRIVICLSENSVNADFKGVGPEGPNEVNCNGHVEVDQRQSQWRDEDQHNGNTGPAEKCASEEEGHNESPVYPIHNGSADIKELDAELERSAAHSSGVTEGYLPAGLEDGELENCILQEQGDDGSDCQDTTKEHLKNGQSAKICASGNFRQMLDEFLFAVAWQC